MLFLVVGFAIPAAANAANPTKGGNNNAGDVWVDNVGQPAGPGHEMDPHLACANINLWGNGLVGGSGAYTIDGWPPSGTMQQAYSGTWNYNSTTGGDQITDVIDVQTLVNNAVANGDAPINKQGFHFKLQFVQNPQKHKTFWVNCQGSTPPAPTPGASVDFSHTCTVERVTVTNTSNTTDTITVLKNGTQVDSFTVPANTTAKVRKYAASVGDKFEIDLNGTSIATDVYKTPVRCTTV